MIEIKEKDKCSGCHACYSICPKQAITMVEDEKGFKYPVINKELCVNCNLCEKVCPIILNKENKNKVEAYMAINLNDKTRKESSSGGVFTLIAEIILDKKGYVFGAMINKDLKVVHSYVDKKEGLIKFRGSKYVQSNIGNSYKVVKEKLDNDEYVLFTGTPCQVEGLYSYLKKEYDKLYTQDIVCHGVPSPLVYEKYIESLEKTHKNKITEICFRNKDNGWKNYNFRIGLKNNKKITEVSAQNIYMKAFLKDIILRDSCYNCSFKKKNRNSDITLADFWGIDKIDKEFDDNKGTSLVIVNSKKGNELFNDIKDKIKFRKTDFEEAIKYNPSMIKSVKIPKERKKFFENINKMEIQKLMKKYIPKQKFKARIRSLIGKILRFLKIIK